MSQEPEEEVAALRARITQLEELVYIDPLTGLKNRRAFEDEIMREISRTNRDKQPVVLLKIDVNRMKWWNDLARDHAVGDHALKAVANALTASTRRVDLACRTGGDEFAVILHAANLEVAKKVAARIVRWLADKPISHPHGVNPVTVSIGGASVSGFEATVEELGRLAERNLYCAKKRGRSQSQIAIR
jgi:diguanylate cyclase (GGDEF)-like protein